MIVGRFRFPIGAQLLGLAVLALAIGGCVGARLIQQSAQDAAFAEAERSLKTRLQTLAQARFPLTQSVLRQLHDLTQDHYVLVTSSETLSTFPDRSAPVPESVSTLRSGFGAWREAPEIRLGAISMLDGRPFRPSVTNIQALVPSDRGILIVWTPEDAWRSSFSKVIGPAFTTAFVVGSLLTLGAFAVAHVYARRLRRLAVQAGQIQAGDFSVLPMENWRDEITTLGEAINQMATQLESLLAADRAAERMRLLSQVSAGLIHDVKNSLAGARLALQLVRMDPIDESDALNTALTQLSSIEQTLSRFLHADGKLPWHPESMSLGSCVESAVANLRNRAEHLGISLSCQSNTLPPIHSDAGLLMHAIGNLISNALDAAGPGGTVRVWVDAVDGFQRVVIQDSGDGIDPALASRLGEPFATGKESGVGLGLTVVRGIAQQAGGSLTWQRISDKWTEFVLAIPSNEHSKTS